MAISSNYVLTYRDVVVASVSLTALCALPVLVPDVVAEGHVAADLAVALVLRRAALGHVVLLLRALESKPIRPKFS